MIRYFITLMFFFGLASCQSKGTFTYQHAKTTDYPINKIVVIIDYLNLRGDLGRYWGFDSYYHQATLDNIFDQVQIILKESGNPEVGSFLLSSGLMIKEEFAVEHYIKEQNQNELLYPPYLLAQSITLNEHIQQHLGS